MAYNKRNTSCEPMDVDLSNSSVKNMDISYNDNTADCSNSNNICDDVITLLDTKYGKINEVNDDSVKEQIIKKYHIKIDKKKNGNNFKLYTIIFTIIILCTSVICYHILNFKCTQGVNIKRLEISLREKLYGQAKAINTLIETISMAAKSKILFFYGGTGVGKTLAASLILENIWNFSNVYHYTMPTFATTFSTEFMLGLNFCDTAVFLVDGLNRNDMQINVHIHDIIKKSEDMGKNVTVILIYNCDIINDMFFKKCDDYFVKELQENFINIKALQSFVKFESLTKEHLIKCVQNEIKNMDVKGYVLDNLLKLFNVSMDGCKGVYTKMKSLTSV